MVTLYLRKTYMYLLKGFRASLLVSNNKNNLYLLRTHYVLDIRLRHVNELLHSFLTTSEVILFLLPFHRWSLWTERYMNFLNVPEVNKWLNLNLNTLSITWGPVHLTISLYGNE